MKWFLLLALVFAFPVAGQERPEVTCKIVDHPIEVMNAQTGKGEERDDWRVHCVVKQADKIVYEEDLVLPYPCDIQTAIVAVEDFRKKRVIEILKKKKGK